MSLAHSPSRAVAEVAERSRAAPLVRVAVASVPIILAPLVTAQRTQAAAVEAVTAFPASAVQDSLL
jgi:hypothetical protein